MNVVLHPLQKMDFLDEFPTTRALLDVDEVDDSFGFELEELLFLFLDLLDEELRRDDVDILI